MLPGGDERKIVARIMSNNRFSGFIDSLHDPNTLHKDGVQNDKI